VARVIPLGSRTVTEMGRVFRRGQAVEITDEALYHHLIRTRRFRDPGKIFTVIRAEQVLPRIRTNALVTVIREMGLGDVLMVLIVLRALKSKYPQLRFRFATGRAYVPLLQGIDFLESVESLMDLSGRISNVIDLRDVVERDKQREVMDRIDLFAAHCGVKVEDYSIPIAQVTETDRDRARELVGHGRILSVAVRGSTHVRTWPLANVQEFAELAASRGWTVAVLDHERLEMPEDPRIVNLTGKIGILDVKAVIAQSELCISSDSGLQHIAEAVGTRCLAIYSTTPPALRIGHYRHVKAIWRESLPCVPCFDRGCPAAPCMQVSPEVVMRAVEEWDALGLSTNVDELAQVKRTASWIEIAAENKIMESWPMAAMG